MRPFETRGAALRANGIFGAWRRNGPDGLVAPGWILYVPASAINCMTTPSLPAA